MNPPRSLSAALLASASLLVSCGKPDRPGEPPQPAAKPVEAVVPGTSIAPLVDEVGDWETEEWAGEIKGRLDELTSAICGEGPPPVTSKDFVGTVLRPEKLEQMGDTVVWRMPVGAQLERMPSLVALVDENQNYLRPSPEHSGAKIVGITAEEDGSVLTAVDFHAFESSRALQINARWSCRWKAGEDGWELRSLELTAYEEVRMPEGAFFVDATRSAAGGDRTFREQFLFGQDHWMARIEMRLGIDIAGWQGAAIADVDGDGLEDIYVSQPGGLPNRLFKHRPDGSIEDVSSASGVDWLESSHGSLFADLDNDSDPDLLVGLSDGILVMENDGSGKFTPVATKLLPAGLAYSLAAADIDQDGDLDFFVCGYTARAGVSRHHLFVHPVPYHDAENGGRNALFRNDGGWRFTDVTRRCGMDQHNTRFSFAASWEDYDLDGDLDLYVANDFGRNNLFRNELSQTGRVQFSDVAEAAGVVDIAPGMSACWGDYDNDGRADLYVGNMFSSAGRRIAAQPKFHASADAETRREFLHHASGNSLFKNVGDGKFSDVGAEMGVSGGRWAWSSKFADLDNDGWQDIVVANGLITQEDTGDL